MCGRLKLPTVVLVFIDGTPALPLSELVIKECMDKVDFGEVVLFSNKAPADKSIRWVDVEIPNIDVAMKLLWYGVPHTLTTSKFTHVLHAHWDAGILDTSVWTDDFLYYDYIGAPWGWHGDNYEVGNGGFSLRSIPLMKFLASCRDSYPFKNPEDDIICRKYRQRLEYERFNWPTIDLASKFAVERSTVAGINKHFGFHGIFNWLRYLPEQALLDRVALLNDYVESRPEYGEVRQQFLGLKLLTKSFMVPRNFPPS